MARADTRGPDTHLENEPLNEVRVRGRLAAPSVEREMPSGDVIACFRLVVDRPAVRPGGHTGARVDTLECAAGRADSRRKVARWEAGDIVEVEGSLRRRFFRAGGGSASRYEIEVRTLTRVARAPVAERATMAG